MGIVNDGVRYCALKLVIVDERDENILSYEVMYDVLRCAVDLSVKSCEKWWLLHARR